MRKRFKGTFFGLLFFSFSFVPFNYGFLVDLNENKTSLLARTAVLSWAELDLTKRVPDQTVNEIFADNILLNLHYIKGDVGDVSFEPTKNEARPVLWDKVRTPFMFSITLNPGEVFAFHDQILPEFGGKKVMASWTQFSRVEGYKTYAGLSGNGVCHLATLINYTATKAGLKVTALTRHDFFKVDGFDRTFGTSIYYGSGGYTAQLQNLYIENTFGVPVTFIFMADSQKVELSIGLLDKTII